MNGDFFLCFTNFLRNIIGISNNDIMDSPKMRFFIPLTL